MEKLQAERLCRVLVEKCIGIRPGEVSLIVTSPAQSAQVGKELFRSLTARGSRAMMLFVPEVLLTEDRLPSAVATSMKQANVTVLYTQRMFPMSARDAALKAGNRIVSLSGIDDTTILKLADVDYDELEAVTLAAARAFTETPEFTIKSAGGTDLTVRIEPATIKAFTGVARHAGDWTELPAGGLNVIVNQGSANGKIVVDGSISRIGLVSGPVTLTVSEGAVVGVDGGADAIELRSLFDKGDENGRLLTEFGAGFNPVLPVKGNLAEDQRAAGVALFGFGRNSHLSGKVHSNLHLDVCVKECRFLAGAKELL